ncbi:protein of unknown function [Streptococcus thermophilus]|nr:protein of unknown function [Streptococcus thermophilus]CAD0167473.1 protein of unknown function [Streptococcus thermophilus]CAD0169543.1 protein of unknown function [Streptococcus thermophilus]
MDKTIVDALGTIYKSTIKVEENVCKCHMILQYNVICLLYHDRTKYKVKQYKSDFQREDDCA